MKQFFSLLVLSLALSMQAQTEKPLADNPVIWADMPDPDVIRVGDTFYFISTTMFFMPGAPIYQSNDLVNWQLAGYVFDRLTDSPKYDLQQGTAYGRGQWATSLKYHDGRFYALFAPNEQGDMGRTYIYSAEQASGPWTLVSRLPHFHDASLLFDDDGRVYVYYGTGEQVELTSDLQHVVEGSHRQLFQREADETGLLEGSRVVKYEGHYYLLMISHVYAPGRHRREVCYHSDTPTGPWEKKVILESDLNGFGYVGQGTIFDAANGDWYAVIFQDRGAVGRVPTLMPCRWMDGWPMLGDGDGRVPETVAPLASPASLPPSARNPTIPLWGEGDFQWNHNPVEQAWSVSERKGWLRLKTSRIVSSLYLAPNTLTQRMYGPKCSATVRLDATHLNDGDRAGFAAFNSQSGVLTVRREGRRLMLTMSTQQVSLTERDKAVENVEENIVENLVLSKRTATLYLRIDGDFRRGHDIATFYYSTDGTGWTKIGSDFRMRFDWRRLFVGTRFALFCYATKRSGGYADFADFQSHLSD